MGWCSAWGQEGMWQGHQRASDKGAAPVQGGPSRDEMSPEQRKADEQAREIIADALGYGRVQIAASYLVRQMRLEDLLDLYCRVLRLWGQQNPENKISDSLRKKPGTLRLSSWSRSTNILLTARYACLSLPCHVLVDLRVDFSRLEGTRAQARPFPHPRIHSRAQQP
jgi:hypothetical protein